MLCARAYLNWEEVGSDRGGFLLDVLSGLCVREGMFSCGARVRLVLAGLLPTLRVGTLVRVLGRAGRELGARFVPRTNRKRAPQTARPLHPAPALCRRQEP
jgi:hypothetical protein